MYENLSFKALKEILEVTKYLGISKKPEALIHNVFYLLQQTGIDFSFRFRWFNSGLYSFELHDELCSVMDDKDIIDDIAYGGLSDDFKNKSVPVLRLLSKNDHILVRAVANGHFIINKMYCKEKKTNEWFINEMKKLTTPIELVETAYQIMVQDFNSKELV